MKRIRACQETDLEGYYVFDESYSTEARVLWPFILAAVEWDTSRVVFEAVSNAWPFGNAVAAIQDFP